MDKLFMSIEDMKYNPIILVLDYSDLDVAYKVAQDLKPFIGMVKLGLEFFTNFGPYGVQKISELGIPIFLDLKLHDIPNTVAKATAAATKLNIAMLSIHCLGGEDMLKGSKEASLEAAQKFATNAPMILGISILTSMDQNDLYQIGIRTPIENEVFNLAELAVNSGIDALVCSPLELQFLKSKYGTLLKFVVPGIRMEHDLKNDQKRILSPKQALENGADYLVIGRPITAASNMSQAAKEILETIES